MEKQKRCRWPRLLAALALVLILLGLDYWNLLPHRTYTAEHFGIETLQSPLDADGDGIDDYTDLMLGARQDAENHPAYDPGYFAGGYPPEDRGVCTDVVWRAFQNAGMPISPKIPGFTRGCRARPIPTSISAGSPICGCFLRDMPKA